MSLHPAIYARKSTLQRGDEETRSTARQVADARTFAARLGVPPIPDMRLYIDEAVSGADVKNLRARARLIADVEAGKIDLIIMADMSRFSRRDGSEVTQDLKRLARKASIYFYETGQRFMFGDIGTNIANYAQAESNAHYRRQNRTKTLAAMKKKAEAGHALGSAPFGYRHEDVLTGSVDSAGRPIRSHVTRRVYEPEAAVVREIWERYAAGQGLKKIAEALNRKGTRTPRPRKLKGHDGVVRPMRQASWSTSNVRSILRQPLYRGVARWNRLKQHDDDGPQRTEINPESDHITYFDPAWRIVPEDIADAVEALFNNEERRKFKSKPGARAKYLLSGGMLLCPKCGGRFEALNGKYYVCATRRHAGTSVCDNGLALRIEVMDEAVLGLIEGQVLHPKFIEQVLSLACDNRTDDAREVLQAQRDDVAAKVDSLARAIEMAGEDIPELLDRLKLRRQELAALDRRLSSMAEPLDRAVLKGALQQRTNDWRKRLRSGHPDEARYVVQQLIGPLTLWFGTAADFDIADAALPGDARGTEGIEWEDCGLRAVVTPLGLLHGLGALSVVAGARNKLYRQLCWAAA